MKITIPDNLAFLDCETMGLSLEHHDVWEIAVALGEGPVNSWIVAHDPRKFDPRALALNGYRERLASADVSPDLPLFEADFELPVMLDGMTIVGANPSFDTVRLERRWGGKEPWKYRKIDVESMAVPILGLTEPIGLKGLVNRLVGVGFEIPLNDHTAAGDVLATREVYRALMDLALGMGFSAMRGDQCA